MHYRLSGLAVAYDDVVDVNLRVWGDEWEVGLDRLEATLTTPNGEPVRRVWGHPVSVRGDVQITRTARCSARSTFLLASGSRCAR